MRLNVNASKLIAIFLFLNAIEQGFSGDYKAMLYMLLATVGWGLLAIEEQKNKRVEETENNDKPDAVLYQELIFAVGNKFPNETRHETALRYIKQAETNYDNTTQLRAELSKVANGQSNCCKAANLTIKNLKEENAKLTEEVAALSKTVSLADESLVHIERDAAIKWKPKALCLACNIRFHGNFRHEWPPCPLCDTPATLNRRKATFPQYFKE